MSIVAVISAIDGINRLIEKFGLGVDAGLKLYNDLKKLTMGTADPLPDLPDSAVIALFKQRAEDGREWVAEERERIAEILAREGAV